MRHGFPRPLVCAALLAVATPAQIGGDGRDGLFDPGISTTLDTNRPGGEFFFSRIWVRPGVRVTITGPNPAILHVQSSVVIDGELVADGQSPPQLGGCCAGGAGGPGGFPGGTGNVAIGRPPIAFQGLQGGGPGGGGWSHCYTAPPPLICYGEGGGGGHATAGRSGQYGGVVGQGGPPYGSALPFDLRGGSGGSGGIDEPQVTTFRSGAGGGGTLVVLADGPILVFGTVSARGGDSVNEPWRVLFGGAGAGGSILPPSGELAIPIPDEAQLVGLRCHAQGLNVATMAATPRFTNRLETIVAR